MSSLDGLTSRTLLTRVAGVRIRWRYLPTYVPTYLSDPGTTRKTRWGSKYDGPYDAPRGGRTELIADESYTATLITGRPTTSQIYIRVKKKVARREGRARKCDVEYTHRIYVRQ
jgi:hypothetical protein